MLMMEMKMSATQLTHAATWVYFICSLQPFLSVFHSLIHLHFNVFAARILFYTNGQVEF